MYLMFCGLTPDTTLESTIHRSRAQPLRTSNSSLSSSGGSLDATVSRPFNNTSFASSSSSNSFFFLLLGNELDSRARLKEGSAMLKSLM